MKLSEEDVQKILRIVDELDYGEIRLEIGDLRIHVQKSGHGAPSPATRPADPPAPSAREPRGGEAAPSRAPARATGGIEAVAADGRHFVRAPTSGVFYRAPAPGADPFVRVGQTVAPADTVCLLEVMKLCTSVAAGVPGRVAEALAEDGEAVSEGQPLFAIEPA